MNKVVKQSVDYQKLNWIQLTDKMFNLINNQLKEIEKAVIEMGEYSFTNPYKFLEINGSPCLQFKEKSTLKRVFEKSCVSIKFTSPCVADMPSSTVVKDLSVTSESRV